MIEPPGIVEKRRKVKALRKRLARARGKRSDVRKRLAESKGRLERAALKRYLRLLERTVRKRKRAIRKLNWGPYGLIGPAPGVPWKVVADTQDGYIPFEYPDAMENIAETARLHNRQRAVLAKSYSVKVRHVRWKRHSYVRSRSHNDSIPGSAYTSTHTTRNPQRCCAVDTHFEVKRDGDWMRVPARVQKWSAEQIPEFKNGGIGLYTWGCHQDHRGYARRW